MKQSRVVFRLILALLIVGSVSSAEAADSDTLTILQSIKGNWQSEILGMDGKNYIRPWVFKVEGNDFVSIITRPGMPSEEGRVSLNEITNDGGELHVSIPFPPYTSKANLTITKGAIKGTAWRQGRTPAPSDIVFRRR
jgi:hypothetical protein